jgi:flagellar motor component MotA
MKVRTKIRDSKKYDPLVKAMDELIQTEKKPTYSVVIKLTMDLCEYIERTGITSVETKTEYLHPSQAIKGKFKVF